MFLITRRKRYAALFLAVFLSCSCIVGSHQEAHALAIGGVAVTAGEVVAFLLAAFGILAASAAVYENSDSIKAWGEEQLEEFKLYASGFATVTGKTAEEIAADIDVWTALAIAGTLDKASYVYDMFKKWCEGLAFDESLFGATGDEYAYAIPAKGIYVYEGTSFIIPKYYGKNTNFTITITGATDPCYTIVIHGTDRVFYPYVVVVSDSKFSKAATGNAFTASAKSRNIVVDGTSHTYYYASYQYTNLCWYSDLQGIYHRTGEEYYPYVGWLNLSHVLIPDSVPNLDSQLKAYFADLLYGYVLGGLRFGTLAVLDSVASKVIARDRAIANVDIIPADAIADAGVETVPIDWSKIRSVAGALSDVVEGTSTIDAVLNQVGVEVIDKTGAITVPVPPADTEEFTMEGLESLFPFCLPFDLIDFFQVLSAEPEAPHFQWPIRYMAPDGPKEYVVDIDLSPFDSVAAILRKMELLAFIVGLIMITREKMIRG